MTKIDRVVVAKQKNQRTRWVWEEPYFAVMREQNPLLVPERLVTAEKAIFLRIERLREAPENLPELKALREALNSLYPCDLKKSVALPLIMQDPEEYQARQRRRAKLIRGVAIAVILSLATGWILATKSLRNDIQGKRNASEPDRNVASSNSLNVRELYNLDLPPEEPRSANQENGLKSFRAPLPKPPSARNPNDSKAKVEVGDAKDEAAVASLSPLAAVPSGQPAKSPPSQSSERLTPLPTQNGVGFPLSLKRPKVAPEIDTESQGSPPAIMEQLRVVDIESKPPEARTILHGSVTVGLGGYPSVLVPELKSSAVGEKLQIGEVVSRINPVYPEEAEWQRIEGIVKLHVIIGTDGTVRYIKAVSGPLPLAAAAVSALRQWRYQPTRLAGRPVENGRDFNVIFRLEPSSSN